MRRLQEPVSENEFSQDFGFLLLASQPRTFKSWVNVNGVPDRGEASCVYNWKDVLSL